MGRLAISLAIYLAAVFVWRDATREVTLVASLIFIVAMAFTVASAAYSELYRRPLTRIFFGAQVLMDLGVVTAIVHITGGSASQFAALYILVIAVASLVLTVSSGLLVAAAGCLMYFVDVLVAHRSSLDLGLWLQLCVFAGVALSAGYIAARLREMHAGHEELAAELVKFRLQAADTIVTPSLSRPKMRSREVPLGWVLLGSALVPDILQMSTRSRLITLLPWFFVAGAILSPLRSTVAARSREMVTQTRVRSAFIIWAGLCLASVAVVGLFGAVFLLVWGVAAYVFAALLLPTRAAGTIIIAGATAGVVACCTALAAEAALRTPAFEQQQGGPRVASRFFETASDQLWMHNVFGFRSPYESVAAGGAWRILALGAGYTIAGHIARTDSTWPFQLERELRRRYPGHAIEVINMGRGTYTTANVAELLRRLGWQFEPDLVVVEWDPNQTRASRSDFGHEDMSYRTVLPERFRRGLIRTSALLFFVEHRFNIWLQHGALYRQYLPFFEPGAKGYPQTLEAVREMGESARVRRTPMVLMLFPDLVPGTWSPDSYPFRAPYRRVAEVGASAGTTVLDLVPVFANQHVDGRHWWATPYSSNPNGAAYLLAARTLADLIVRCGWLDRSVTEHAGRPRNGPGTAEPRTGEAQTCLSRGPEVGAGSGDDTTTGRQSRPASGAK